MLDPIKFTKLQRVTLTASQVTNIDTSTSGGYIIIQNLGPGSVFVDVSGGNASATSWEILEGDIFPAPVKTAKVSLYSTGTPTVQVGEISYVKFSG